MSGDVQPRKRKKDAKKKKDSEAEMIFTRKLSGKEEEKESTVSGVKSLGTDDQQMHIHKDSGTGGHWCAKIVFFFLLAILAGLVGLIILENRGQSDLDTPLSQSRYSEILEGWVQEDRDAFEEHDAAALDELDNHDHDNEPFEEEPGGDDDDDEENSTEEAENDDNDTRETSEDDRDLPHRVKRELADSDDDAAEASKEAEQDADNDSEEENDDDDEEEDVKSQQVDEDDNNTQEDDENATQEDDGDNESLEKEQVNDSGEDEEVVVTSRQTSQQQNAPFEERSPTDDRQVSVEELQAQVDQMKRIYDKLAMDLKHKPFEELKVDRQTRSVHQVEGSDDDDENDTQEDDIDNESLEEVVDNDGGEEAHLRKLAEAKRDASKDEDDSETNEEDESANSASHAGVESEPRRVSFSETTLIREQNREEDEAAARKFSTGDEAFESLEVRRRLTIVPPGGLSGDEEEDVDLDIAYDDELIYGEQEDDEELYERYSDEEVELEEQPSASLADEQPEVEIHTPHTFEELNALYQPKYEEKLTTIESKFARSRPGEQMLSPTSSVNQPRRISPTGTVPKRENSPRIESKPIVTEKEVSPKALPQLAPHESQLKQPKIVNVPENVVRQTDEFYDDDEEEEDYSGSEGEEELSDVDDDDLMRRLEAKYGKLPEQQQHAEELEDSEVEEYSEEDDDPSWTKLPPSPRAGGGAQQMAAEGGAEMSADEFRRANQFLNNNPSLALSAFEKLLLKHPDSFDASNGRARALQIIADESPDQPHLLLQSIDAHEDLILKTADQMNDELFNMVTAMCLDQLKFLGLHKRAKVIHEAIVKRFPSDPERRAQQAINLLYLNDLASAKRILHETLMNWRYHGTTLIYYAYVRVQLDKDYEGAARYFQEGVDAVEETPKDARVYLSWGEALQRLNRNDDAMEVFRKGAALNLYPSAYQRSLYNVVGLHSQPFWSVQQTRLEQKMDTLQRNWEKIRDEGLSVLNEDGNFAEESEQLLHVGDWQQFVLFARGEKHHENCLKTPLTCQMIEKIPEVRFCRRGQVKFSVLAPGTHVWPHCGPTNCRLRAHLALRAEHQSTFIRVADEKRSWQESEWLIFDDSFEHEVWHNGTQPRLVLIVDLWHPDVNEYQREKLPAI